MMIPRYERPTITATFSSKAIVLRWQEVELAVIKARESLGLIPNGTHERIQKALVENPCDITWWLEREKLTNHDLAAWIEERLRFIPVELQRYWHQDMTSYDTEDAAFSRALLDSSDLVSTELQALIDLLGTMADKHRFTVMLERTHGQGAKLRSFGGRVLTWLAPLKAVQVQLHFIIVHCRISRISGAIGNYGGGMTPEIEEKALATLGLRPFYGATQILPRVLLAPLAHALGQVAEVLAQSAMDFRLGARSGKPLWHEPFGSKQKGSSAMPHKKNPINTEQMEGMLALVHGAILSITQSIQTWEGRAINQSCVERVAWPDLFHEVLRMLSVMRKVFGGMVIYQDHMMQEIQESRGTYASDEAKNFLAAKCSERGLEFEVAYRIMQLASFNALSPSEAWTSVRAHVSTNLTEVDDLLADYHPAREWTSIQDLIAGGYLTAEPQLEVTEEQAAAWNALLAEIFADKETRSEWDGLFKASYLLRNEDFLFKKIIGK
jgi:adenylosuccinate lyase